MQNLTICEERNKMNILTNGIATVASKPITGITIGLSASILAWIGAITAVVGLLAACVGLIAAIYSFVHNRKLVKLDNLQIAEYEKK
jgi:hypothetical protein